MKAIARITTLLATVFVALPLLAQTEVEVDILPDPVVIDAANAEEFQKAIFFGEKFFDLGDFDSARAQFENANALAPDHPTVLYNLAVAHAKQGRFAEAQSWIDRYGMLYPTGSELPLIQKLQLELDFLRELERKQQADQDYAELFNRGKFEFERGNYEQALDIFAETEKQRPADPAIHFNQALAWEALGEYVKATERLRRYLAVSQGSPDKTEVDRKIFTLESEVNDMHSRFLCPFCGYKLAAGAMWCQRCWHGPYIPRSPVWNTRVCGQGGTATRATFYSDGRLHQNEDLPCLIKEANFAETLSYSRAKQRAIQKAREAEGWTYDGDVIQQLSSGENVEFKLVQNDSLVEVQALSTGDVLDYRGKQFADGRWQLEYEEYIIDGQLYVKRYTYDGNGRLAREVVDYHNKSACGHLITVTATYQYEGERPSRVIFEGGYVGYQAEGAPNTKWKGVLAYLYDNGGRVQSADFVISEYTKTYAVDTPRDVFAELRRMHAGLRTRKPIDLLASSDHCTVTGSRMISNQIDLRPFYTVSPNIATLLPAGVTRMTISFTYPDNFSIE